MATGPGDGPAAAGRDRLRAGHADREQVIGTLKAAFVQGMLAKDEFDARVSQAFASRTCAELAAVTADLPAGLAAAGQARPPVRVRRRPLARAAARSGGCLTIAAAAVWGAFILDPGPFARGTAGPPGVLSPGLMFVIALYAVLAAFGFLAFGMSTSLEQRRSRGQLPPGPGPGGHAPDAGQSSGPGHGPVPPTPAPARPAPACVLTSHRSAFPPGRPGQRAASGPRRGRPGYRRRFPGQPDTRLAALDKP